MNKYIKSNLFVISIIVFLGLITMLFNTLNYNERRIFQINYICLFDYLFISP